MISTTSIFSAEPRRFFRHWLSGRRGVILAALIFAVAGLSFSWGWLVTAGVAPFLLSLLPCAAMCALGLCMQKMGGKSCAMPSNQTSDGPEGR